jgi:hypothetical protein
VLENEHATNRDYLGPVIHMLDSVCGREFEATNPST